MLVISLRGSWLEIVLEGGVLLERLPALIIVRDDLLGLKDTDSALGDIQVHGGLGVAEGRQVARLIAVPQHDCVSYSSQG